MMTDYTHRKSPHSRRARLNVRVRSFSAFAFGAWVMLFSLLASIATVSAEIESSQKVLAQGVHCFRTGCRLWNVDFLKEAEKHFEHAIKQKPKNAAAHYWLGACTFHIILHCYDNDGTPDKSQAIKKYTTEAISSLRKAIELNPRDGESHALLGTLLGMLIRENPLSSLWRGPRIKRHQDAALRLAPESPRIYYLMGSARFHSPGILGSKEDALDFFLKAEKYYEKEQSRDQDPLAPQWGYSHCLAFIGQTYDALGKDRKAQAYYKKALSINPHNWMAREGLHK
ncbi:MAG: tetratricopeptide repeat protein [Candidatus Pacebacteria bacterium]|nr:tetratricopeptide repeat protein [Candidatus Paceibacterota bacterium]